VRVNSLEKFYLSVDRSILNRAVNILEKMAQNPTDELDWFGAVQLIALEDASYFYVWLAITGCYPSKFELLEFTSFVQVNGLKSGAYNLIRNRSENFSTASFLKRVVLITPAHNEMVDVTHTLSMHYLTGIQRVVYGITQQVSNIVTYSWVGQTGIMIQSVLGENRTNDFNMANRISWQRTINRFLHSLSPVLEMTPAGKKFRQSILPMAKRLKGWLRGGEIKKLLKMDNAGELNNLLILNARLTIPEIPAPEHIYLYEAMLENSIVFIQVILFDFIPFFHAWTVHFENRGSLNVYIRLVLLADRVISISELVQEQAVLITQAFKLERVEWRNRKQTFDFLPLPSGLAPAEFGEFSKDPLLVVMAGSLEPRKNHMQFLDAIEIIVNHGRSIKAEILGSAGWQNNHILDRIHSLQRKGVSIVRLGNLSDSQLRERIGKAQALLQISEAEGFGLPIVEALALGTKVVTSDVRPLVEWAGDRVQTVKLGDAQELAQIILKILDHPEDTTNLIVTGVSWSDWTNLLFMRS